ncbi:Warthog protein 1 [Trichostrongylus colubriformis]|uniref:Warthog protein 1 n=1 Tax=Trichostrongylus colubriformis TaxID=6319 RepID=A0AAN8INM9_TRICO
MQTQHKEMLLLIILLTAVPLLRAASCGGSAIPFRFEVLPSGNQVLGCASPSCFGGGTGGSSGLNDALFQPTAEGEDGFIREGDQQRTRTRLSSAPAQQAQCPVGFDSNSCASDDRSWVGGFLASPDGSLRLQCCTYEGMRFAEEVGRPIVHSGEVYSGGEVLRDGRQTGFDLISNVKRIDGEDGRRKFRFILVSLAVTLDINDISRILDKVGDVRQQPAGDAAQQPAQQPALSDSYEVPVNEAAAPAEEIVQVGEQVVPVTSAGFYYPVASGVPACFTGDTTVETPSGMKRMDELKIGDLVLTAEMNSTVFTPVTSFLHRLPDTVASFIKLETDNEELKLTPQHFIYKVDCHDIDYNVDMRYAEELKAGDCLYQTRDSALHKVVIRTVSVVRERGVYAPMTTSGDLLANNIYVSCHNVIKTSTLSQTFLDFAADVQRKMLRLAVAVLLCVSISSARRAINGTQCIKNQVITRITVFEDGTLEAECGPIPCGEVGRRCIQDQASCRADTDVFSGMRWAPNGQSVLLRCCTIKVPNKIYVGTDLVTAGSYYEGGVIAKKDMYYPKGREYDFIANVRTEQSPHEERQRIEKEMQEGEETEDEEEEEGGDEGEEEATEAPQEFNPLRYRPTNLQRTSTGRRHA